MAKPTLLEKLKRYTPDAESRAFLEQVTDYSCMVNSDKRALEIQVQLPEPADKQILYQLEENIRAAYDINSVRIFPHYPPETFTPAYLPQVITELQKIGAVSKGFFEDYRYDLFDEEKKIVVEVFLPDGGVNLLCHAQTPAILAGIIRSEFGLEYEVELRRSPAYSVSYDEYQQQRREADLNALSEEIRNRPAEAPVKESPPEEAKPQLPRQGSVDAAKEEDCVAEKIDGTTYRCGNTVFDIAEAELVFGEDFDIVPTPIAALNAPKRNTTVLGSVFSSESKQNRSGDKTILSFCMTDNKASVTVKSILPNEDAAPLLEGVSDGAVIALHGSLRRDKFDNELALTPEAVKKIKKIARKDMAEVKRVELHIHSQLSTMDATIPPEDIIKTATKWGHRAVAITDHGNVQGFPMIMEAAESLETETKILYGMEGYFVNDAARAVYVRAIPPSTTK